MGISKRGISGRLTIIDSGSRDGPLGPVLRSTFAIQPGAHRGQNLGHIPYQVIVNLGRVHHDQLPTLSGQRSLDGGADDYLTKPFNLDELFARLRALSRRGPIPRPPTLEAGDLRLDPSEHRVWRAETEIRLSHKEFTLLEALIRRPGIVHTRAQLLERCWDAAYEARSNIVDVYIRYLRDKIDRPFGVTSLETIRGAGYRLRKDGGRHALPR